MVEIKKVKINKYEIKVKDLLNSLGITESGKLVFGSVNDNKGVVSLEFEE